MFYLIYLTYSIEGGIASANSLHGATMYNYQFRTCSAVQSFAENSRIFAFSFPKHKKEPSSQELITPKKPLERRAMASHKKDQSIAFLPADKGGAIVVLDRVVYIQKAQKRLSDETTYSAFANSCPLQIDTIFFQLFIATISNYLQASFISVIIDWPKK